MTTVRQIESNPFALMTDPAAIFAAMAGSDRLARLKSRICRPLDKPLVARTGDAAAAFDKAEDAAVGPEDAEG